MSVQEGGWETSERLTGCWRYNAESCYRMSLRITIVATLVLRAVWQLLGFGLFLLRGSFRLVNS